VGDGTDIVVTEDDMVYDFRLVAFDRVGKRHDNFHADNHRGKTFRMHDLELPTLKPEAIERFEVQVRPLETIEFNDVALPPVNP
jgi:hypothetical protein